MKSRISSVLNVQSLKQNKTVLINFICAFAASAVTNFVLQFVVYPAIERNVGEEMYGKILFFITLGIISGLSFGGAANTTYLKSRQKFKAENGDFIITLTVISIIVCTICLIPVNIQANGGIETLFVLVFIVLSIFKDYSFVDFQLKNDYPMYLVYSVVISAGYCISVPIIIKTGNWIFLSIGLIAGLIFVIIKGDVYKKPFTPGNHLKSVMGSTFILSGSNLINYGTQNLDRIILLPLVNGTAVTYYYVASLLSKTLSMITGPVNNLIVSYMTREKKSITRKSFLFINIVILAFGGVFYLLCLLISPLLLKMPFLYPDLVENVRGIIPGASLSQVFVICSSVVVALDIVIAPERFQMYIQSAYAGVFLVLAFLLTKKYQLNGFIIAACVSSAIRYLISFMIGFAYIKKGAHYGNN